MAWTSGDPVWLESPNDVARSHRPDDVTDRFVSWFSDAGTGTGVHKMFAEIFGGNVRSHRLAIAAGYELEGVLRDHYVASDGQARDISMYGMFEAGWWVKRQFMWLPVWRAGLAGRSDNEVHSFRVEHL